MENSRPLADDGLIFVLDIGTRSVIGIAGRRQGDVFHVAAHAVATHPRRAMIDGQIEDIEQVARVAAGVKEDIEAQLGVRFRHVSVAAAGRALKTNRATAALAFPAGTSIGPADVFRLEYEAVNAARQQLDAESAAGDSPYYYAGHSVVRYQLDGYPFSTILGHQGERAEAQIIATFLPAEVVGSLRRCMALLELEIDTLTLEPIAAMRAVIPQDLRLLNLALVDIGAGTSDIALSCDSTVSGYTMATIAGDEVTEAVIRQYLVDFGTAEEMKLAAAAGVAIPYTDILGQRHEVPGAEVLQAMEPAVASLAKVIADKITECNGAAPAAVFLVGGGSKTPGLREALAGQLGLAQDRVALAGHDFSGRLLNEDAELDDPEYATPVGITLVAADNAESGGAAVLVNGRRVRLFMQRAASVMDALLLAGYQYSDLMGRNGRTLAFTLNGVRTVLRGEAYTTAEITLNGVAAALTAPVENDAVIEIVPAKSGADAQAYIADYAEGALPLAVRLNGQPLAAGLVALVNGTLAPPDTPIFDGDDVSVHHIDTVAQLCAAAGIDMASSVVTVNGEAAEAGRPLRDGDDVATALSEAAAAAAASRPPLQYLPAEPANPETRAKEATGAATATEAAGAAQRPTASAAATVGTAPSTAAMPRPAEALTAEATGPQAGGASAPAMAASGNNAADTSAATPAARAENGPAVANAAPKTERETVGAVLAPSVTAPRATTPQPLETPLAKASGDANPTVADTTAATDAVAPGKPQMPTEQTDSAAVNTDAGTDEHPTAAQPAGTAPADALKPSAPPPAEAPAAQQKGAAEATPTLPAPNTASKEAPAPAASTPKAEGAKPPAPPPSAEPATPADAPPAAHTKSLRIQLNGKTVVLPPKPDAAPYQLFDLFALVDIDPSRPQGMVKTLLNGRGDASYLDELSSGDTVEIGWEK
ncbi:MAG: cell division FtsA domain-containing protein [Oscillospiraceae bacterium]